MEFEWDSEKAASNERKHGVTFDDARAVFDCDPLVEASPRSHTDEHRFTAIGELPTGVNLIVTVVFTPRLHRIRIISARPASREERNRYHAHRQD